MKKVYSKPDVVFESFSLSTSIAVCAYPTNTQAVRQCAYDYGGMMIFLEEMTGVCLVGVDDGSSAFDEICYHVPTQTTALFNS